MNKTTTLRNLFAVLAILGVASAAPAAILFTETFSYPDGHLASSPPSGGVSGGLWIVHEAFTPYRLDVSNGKVTVFQASRTLCVACVTSHGEDVHRDFPVLAVGQTVFAGFDVTASGNDDVVYFAEFMGAPTRLFVIPFTGSNFTFGIGNGVSPTTGWASGLTFGTTYRVVMSYEFDTGRAKLWVNPANESSTNVQAAGFASLTVSAIALRQYYIATIGIPSRQVLDNLVVGTTFNDVLAIPAPTLPGDFNNNGIVDAADYVVWRKNDSTQTDYDTFRTHFGQTAGGGAFMNSAVPEPATLATLLTGVLIVFARRSADVS
jgi:hypothetical protein